MATIPSIAMIPSGYKANKVYSVLPTDGSGDLDFARTTKATRVNQNGLIEEVAIDVPRLDYTDGGCPSLLLEGNSTNLITESELFDNAYWTKSGATVTSGFSAPSVDSTLGAFKLVGNSSLTLFHSIYLSSVSPNDSLQYTRSIYAKQGTERYLAFASYTSAENGVSIFDLQDGVVSQADAFHANVTMISLTNGWYRCSIETTSNNIARTGFAVGLSPVGTGVSADLKYDAIGKDIYIFASQLEQNSSATSYIKTSGTTISRTADSASKSGISSLINSSEGVLFVEISALSDSGTFRAISLSASATNAILFYYSSVSNSIICYITSSGVQRITLSHVLTDETVSSKIALKYKSGDFALWVDGIEVDSSTSGALMPSNLDKVSFNNGGGASPFYGKVKDLRVYKTILSDSELTTLTTI